MDCYCDTTYTDVADVPATIDVAVDEPVTFDILPPEATLVPFPDPIPPVAPAPTEPPVLPAPNADPFVLTDNAQLFADLTAELGTTQSLS